MIRAIGKAPSELKRPEFLIRLRLERDRIREALLNFIPLKAKKAAKAKKPKKPKKSETKTLMQVLKAKGLTLEEVITLVKAEKEGGETSKRDETSKGEA